MDSAASRHASMDRPMIPPLWVKITCETLTDPPPGLIQTSFTHLHTSLKAPPQSSWRRSLHTSSGSFTQQRPHYLFRLINLSSPILCHSAHAQPPPVTITLLAYAKCQVMSTNLWSNTLGSPISGRDHLHQLAKTGLSSTWPWSDVKCTPLNIFLMQSHQCLHWRDNLMF